jgi:hypothetical protein
MIKKLLINFAVIGESGNLKLDGIRQHLSNLSQGENYWMNFPTTTHSTNDSYLVKWKSFIECLDLRKLPMAVVKNGSKTLDIIEAGLETAPTRKQIKVQKSSCEED